MAITGAPSSPPALPAITGDQPPHRPTQPAPPAKDDAPKPATGTTVENAPPPKPAPFALTQHYDQAMRRLILEARDPASGFVIYQMPPKYVIKQFSASVSTRIAPARGARIDSAA